MDDNNGWIELKEGCEMPDYDIPVLWYDEHGHFMVQDLDKDGNPWLYGGADFEGFEWPKITHWRYLPSPPKTSDK